MIRYCLVDKTPHEEDVYTIDWKPHLGEDTLTGPTPHIEVLEGTVIVDGGTNDLDNGVTSFWVRGGEKGEVARFTVGVDTVAGKDLDAFFTIGVR